MTTQQLARLSSDSPPLSTACDRHSRASALLLHCAVQRTRTAMERAVTAAAPPFNRPSPRRSWLGPPLRTLRQSEFGAACGQLMRLVEADYAPTLVVGIRTGGFVVAQSMVRAASAPLPVLPLTCRRAATCTKSRLPTLRTVLTALPRPAVGVLRRIEHRWLIAPRTHRAREQSIDHSEANAIGTWLATRRSLARILVVDDAVDSGVTLATVLRRLREVSPFDVEIRSAAITQTLEHPIVTPDYLLFDGTLCRFPWSLDASD